MEEWQVYDLGGLGPHGCCGEELGLVVREEGRGMVGQELEVQE